MKKIILFALVVIMLSVTLIGCGNQTEIVPLPDYINGENGEEETNNADSPDYSSFIGTWQGYAIAVTQTVVITDVQGDMFTFYFKNISSIDSEFDTTSDEMTMPIVDNQITAPNAVMNEAGELFAIEVNLTFYENHIEWRIVGVDGDFWWTLTRV